MNLSIGTPAPNFSANNQRGEIVTLNNYAGKKLVLYFYPKDDTPGCTAEACSLRDNYEALLAQGYAILGVSPDKEAKHQKFIEKYNLPFDLQEYSEQTLQAYAKNPEELKPYRMLVFLHDEHKNIIAEDSVGRKGHVS